MSGCAIVHGASLLLITAATPSPSTTRLCKVQSAPLYRHWSSVQAVWPIRGSRGIALLFHDHDTRREWGVSVTPRPALYHRERPSTHCTGGWVGSRAGLDRCGKISPPRGFDPWTVQPVASRYTDWATRTNLWGDLNRGQNGTGTDFSPLYFVFSSFGIFPPLFHTSQITHDLNNGQCRLTL